MQSGEFKVTTSAHMEMMDITPQVEAQVRASEVREGLCIIYNPHTTAGITINEGADPDVQRDLIGVLKRMVPLDYPYQHREGNSPSHMMATMTGSSATVIIERGQLLLGTWQRIFFCEYDGPRSRRVKWKILCG